jgi:hypothetical protein
MCKFPFPSIPLINYTNLSPSFHSFFAHIDNFRDPAFLYLSSKGRAACGAPRMASAGQGFLSKKERKGLHPDRRDRIAGIRKKEEDEDTLVGEDEGMPLKDDIAAAKEEVVAKAD